MFNFSKIRRRASLIFKHNYFGDEMKIRVFYVSACVAKSDLITLLTNEN